MVLPLCRLTSETVKGREQLAFVNRVSRLESVKQSKAAANNWHLLTVD